MPPQTGPAAAGRESAQLCALAGDASGRAPPAPRAERAGGAAAAYRPRMHSLDPVPDSTPDDLPTLRAALAGVRGLVLDADGVLTMKGATLPGVPEAIRALQERSIPFRIATNISTAHRSTVAARLSAAGIPVTEEMVVTAASATAAWAAAAFPGGTLFVIARPDGRREFAGHRLLTVEEALEPDARADAVVLGDADDEMSFAAMNAAFRLVHAGAALLACHRNPWWWTATGPTIDGGAFVRGLEFATGTRARVCGKPSPTIFRTALAGLASDLRTRRPLLASDPRTTRPLLAHEAVMVGDDPAHDIAGARRIGMRGVLVLSGRTTPEQAAQLRRRAAATGGRRSKALPEAIAASLASVVAALG